PDIPIRQALALCPWPGASAERIEELVTRKIEGKVAENVKVDKIESNTRTGMTAVYITLVEGLPETGKEFDDIKLKLDSINDLPEGAGPITFVKDFGDTAALMLTVASPRAGEVEVSARAQTVQRAIEQARATAGSGAPRVSLIQGLPESIPFDRALHPVRIFADASAADGVLRDVRIVAGPGFVGIDAATEADDAAIRAYLGRFLEERLRTAEFHPDSWPAVVIHDPSETRARMLDTAGDKYSYRQLDDYTD